MDVSRALQGVGERHGQGDLRGDWADKYLLNTPGPFYSGDVDNSGPGPAQAPNNVFIDEEGFPFLFRQPTNMFELRQVLLAAHKKIRLGVTALMAINTGPITAFVPGGSSATPSKAISRRGELSISSSGL